MDFQLLVQRKNQVNAAEAALFISKCSNARFALIYFSFNNAVSSINFFDYLMKNLQIPYVGMQSTGTFTSGEGHCDNGVAIAVLCGDFEVQVFHDKIDLVNPENTAKKMIPNLAGADLCLIHSANYVKSSDKLGIILSRVNSKYPKMQIFGGISEPPPLIAVPDGTFEDHISYVAFTGVEVDYVMESGFKVDETINEEYVITKSDETYIYEINGRNAIEEYSRIQHMQPYLVNTIVNLSNRPDIAKLFKVLAKTNRVLYEAVLKIFIKPIGVRISDDCAEVVFPLELNEDAGGLLVQSYKPVGTILRKVKTTKKDQLAVYDRINKRFPDSKGMILISCELRKFWMDFDYGAVEEKMKTLKCPYIKAYSFGEIGTYIPYGDKRPELTNGSTLKVLVFK